MKKRTTVICITIVTIVDCYFNKGIGYSMWLWALYGFYKKVDMDSV